MSAQAPALAPAYAALNAYFDRVFVVTLERAKDRQARAQARLAGLDHALHLGADKLTLDWDRLRADGLYDEARARAASRHGKTMSPGHVGCSLSHRQLYEATVRNGWERVLVFEDDLVPRPDGLARTADVLAQLPQSWELVYLGWQNFERVTLRDRAKEALYLGLSALRLMKWTPAEVRRLHPTPFSANLWRAGLHHCTHAYAFTQAGARKLLAAQTPVAHNADQLLIHLVLRGELEAYVAVPKLFDQEDGAGAASASSFIHEG